MYLKWKCKNCGDIKISNSKRHHEMDFCKCGLTGVDLEEDYMRVSGIYYSKIKEYNYNFFDEIVICMIEQGFDEGILNSDFEKGKIYLDGNTVFKIREIEDKIVGSLK